MANWWSIYSVKVKGSSTLMRAGSTRRISDAGAGENALSPTQLEPAPLLQESLSWLPSTPTALSFIRWVKWTPTLTQRDLCCTGFAKLLTRIDPTGERRLCASWTTHPTTEMSSQWSSSRSRRCPWFSRQNTVTVAPRANSFSLTSREILSSIQPLRQVKSKYHLLTNFSQDFWECSGRGQRTDG